MEKISVIVPVYNVEGYLSKCLDSIICQSYKHLEIICVNDGSTDNSPEILEEYAREDNRIIIITQKNAGLSAARNTGISAATGKYIGFVDSDDWIDQDTYQSAFEEFRRDDSIDIVCWGANVIAEEGYTVNVEPSRKYHKIYLTGKHKIDRENVLKTQVTTWNKLYKCSIIKQNNLTFPDGLLYEDNVFFWKYIVNCKYGFYLNQYFYNYYKRRNSIMGVSNNKESIRLYDRFKGFQELYNSLKDDHFFIRYPDLFEIIFFRDYVQELINSAFPEKVFEKALEILDTLSISRNKEEYFKKVKNEFFNLIKNNILSQEYICTDHYEPKTYNKNILNSLNELGDFLFYPNVGNLGDVAIAQSEYQMFRDQGYSYKVFNAYNSDTKIDRSFNLVYGGGGLFVRYWNYEKAMNLFKNENLENAVILPSSFCDCDDLLEALDERFTVYCREEKSFEYCTSKNQKADFQLAYDMAFSIDLNPSEKPLPVNFVDLQVSTLSKLYYGNYRKLQKIIFKITQQLSDKIKLDKTGQKTAFFLRTDKERLFDNSEYEIIDLSVFAKSHCTDSGVVYLLSKIFIESINMVDIVVTDRLHVGIIGALLKKKVLLLDNTYGKVSGVYRYSMKRMKNVHLLKDISQLNIEIDSMSNTRAEFNMDLTFIDFAKAYFQNKDDLEIIENSVWE